MCEVWLASPSANNSNNVCNVNGNNSNLNNNNSNNYNNMVIQIGLRINRSMNYVISKLKEARVSYYIINRTTRYKEEYKFIRGHFSDNSFKPCCFIHCRDVFFIIFFNFF